MPTSRIEAFSYGVFAIIITLLVLEIHVPQLQDKDISAALAHSLLALTPKFLSYILRDMCRQRGGSLNRKSFPGAPPPFSVPP
jgi:hypothetical protein